MSSQPKMALPLGSQSPVQVASGPAPEPPRQHGVLCCKGHSELAGVLAVFFGFSAGISLLISFIWMWVAVACEIVDSLCGGHDDSFTGCVSDGGCYVTVNGKCTTNWDCEARWRVCWVLFIVGVVCIVGSVASCTGVCMARNEAFHRAAGSGSTYVITTTTGSPTQQALPMAQALPHPQGSTQELQYAQPVSEAPPQFQEGYGEGSGEGGEGMTHV